MFAVDVEACPLPPPDAGVRPPWPPPAAAVRRRSKPGTTRQLATVAGLVAVAALVALPADLASDARVALGVMGVAGVLWACTAIDDTAIAVVGASTLVAAGAIPLADVAMVPMDATVVLVAASFVVAAAVTSSGLADRLTAFIVGRARTVGGLCWTLTAALGATAFAIPATSGRAALAVPMFLALVPIVGDVVAQRAVALVFPTTILLSAIASLLGAGAHLITADVVAALTGEELTFAGWLVLGLPFAVASCASATFVITRLFLTAEQRRRLVDVRGALTRRELDGRARTVATVVVGAVTLWSTGPLHGIPAPWVAIGAAAAVVSCDTIDLRQAVRSVNLDLLAFLAATLVIGEALVSSGAASWLVSSALAPLDDGVPAWVVVTLVAAVSLLAHLAISSRTARATVLVPIVVLLAQATGGDATLLAFVSTAAAGYCLTLPASAKPVAMFDRLDAATYRPADLVRLSAVLVPVHLVLLVVFAIAVWPALGL